MRTLEPLFACSIETWLQKALPANSPRPSDSSVQLFIKGLYEEKECPTLDDHQGLAQILNLLSQPNDTPPDELSNDRLTKGIDTLAADVLQWLQKHECHEYGRRAPVHTDGSLFYHMAYQREDCLPSVLDVETPSVMDAGMVTVLTMDEDDIQGVRKLFPLLSHYLLTVTCTETR